MAPEADLDMPFSFQGPNTEIGGFLGFEVPRTVRSTVAFVFRDVGQQLHPLSEGRSLPRVSIVVPFWGYLSGSLIYKWLNRKKELQWRL